MTIKDFAKLCGCNPQTLRYYDRQDLLKPVKVDDWTGYRYYDEEQAIAFVKIKNMQKAGFSIDEIKELLDKDDAAIYIAFERKIAEQERQLQEIKNIQKTYQTEITEMRKVVLALRDSLMKSMEEYSPAEEFGLSEEEYNELKEGLDEFFGKIVDTGDRSLFDIREIPDRKEDLEAFKKSLNDPDFTTVYENHDWKNVKDFMAEIPEITNGSEYRCLFKLAPEKKANTAFANTFIGTLCMRNQDKKMTVSCNVISSDDGQNHFWCRTK
ncbi:MAG: MerR family transcriptional regulator [Butyrivibrio sp.]|uniref:MerR family transcriptional regulator n=1 Tax=Butyrivibrio sp. TaxID=28121 RepID=UPI0025BCF67F|nr:MerR family transcriptional regulator [Butyrivibrio sp.]MBQ6589440.1 MerR family transcriptional regulator [Butyrivibrio sp.]